MPSAVVDASAVVDLLIHAPASVRIFERLVRSGDALHAPYSIDLEVVHAIRRLWLRGLLVDQDVKEISEIYSRLSIRHHPHRPLLPRVWQLRHNVSAYDAAYVALAEMLDAPLITRDARLAHSSGHAARIEYID